MTRAAVPRSARDWISSEVVGDSQRTRGGPNRPWLRLGLGLGLGLGSGSGLGSVLGLGLGLGTWYASEQRLVTPSLLSQG